MFPNAQLRLCDDPCRVKSVNAKLTLATSHIGKGCDRDTYSVQSQRKLCGKKLIKACHFPFFFNLKSFFLQVRVKKA